MHVLLLLIRLNAVIMEQFKLLNHTYYSLSRNENAPKIIVILIIGGFYSVNSSWNARIVK